MSPELLLSEQLSEQLAEPSTNAHLNHLIAEVQRRSAVDIPFRNLALNDASAALAVVAQEPISTDDLNLQFVDNSGPVKIIPLPNLAQGVVESVGLEEIELGDIRGPEISGWISWSR